LQKHTAMNSTEQNVQTEFSSILGILEYTSVHSRIRGIPWPTLFDLVRQNIYNYNKHHNTQKVLQTLETKSAGII